MNRRRLCVALVLAWPALAAARGTSTGAPETRARDYFGDATLVDQNGVGHRFYTDLLSEGVVLVNLVFTNCPNACPMQTQMLQQVRRQLGERFGKDVRFLSLSIDPERDTPQSMKAFAAKYGADVDGWRFVVAAPETMQQVLGKLGQWSGEPESHSTLLIAGRAGRQHWLKLRPDAPAERIALDLLRLADEA